MQHLEVTFRLETPLYLSGANQSQAQLRVPSIKGALRYWYRAIHANPAREEEIFGSMQHGQSALRLHIEKPTYPAAAHGSIQGSAGAPYLAFSLKNRSYLPPDTSFQLHFHVRKDSFYWQDYLASIWLFTAIGGLGSRIRRGYGGISWVEADTSCQEIKALAEQLPNLSKSQNKEKWLQQLTQGIQTLWSWFPEEKSITHTMIYPELRLFLCNQEFSSWQKAMDTGATILKNFRQGKGKALFDEKPRKEIRESLGGAGDRERNPSPFWLRIVRLGEMYFPVYFLLPTTLADSRFHSGLEMFAAYLCENGFRMEVLHS